MNTLSTTTLPGPTAARSRTPAATASSWSATCHSSPATTTPSPRSSTRSSKAPRLSSTWPAWPRTPTLQTWGSTTPTTCTCPRTTMAPSTRMATPTSKYSTIMISGWQGCRVIQVSGTEYVLVASGCLCRFCRISNPGFQDTILVAKISYPSTIDVYADIRAFSNYPDYFGTRGLPDTFGLARDFWVFMEQGEKLSYIIVCKFLISINFSLRSFD